MWNQLEQVKLISEKPHKKLAFAHIMCPHRPIVFTKNGSALLEEELILAEKDSQHRFYLGQAKFISKKVIQTIDYILDHASEDHVILILSDHGKFSIRSTSKGKSTLPLKEMARRFSNLQALHLPEINHPLFDQITPINTLRTILNHYFGYDLPIIEDVSCSHFYDLNQRIANQIILQSLFPIASP